MHIDNAIKDGTTIIFLCHRLLANAGETATAIADFKALVDYVVERGIDVVSVDEWYEGLTNPRYRSIPLSRATS
jgi:hypothetical protein